jgi:hypothetical protein
VRSVRFGYNGNENYAVESGSPYELCGSNTSPRFAKCTKMAYGTHTITATPYSRLSGRGSSGKTVQIKFTIAPPPASQSPIKAPIMSAVKAPAQSMPAPAENPSEPAPQPPSPTMSTSMAPGAKNPTESAPQQEPENAAPSKAPVMSPIGVPPAPISAPVGAPAVPMAQNSTGPAPQQAPGNAASAKGPVMNPVGVPSAPIKTPVAAPAAQIAQNPTGPAPQAPSNAAPAKAPVITPVGVPAVPIKSPVALANGPNPRALHSEPHEMDSQVIISMHGWILARRNVSCIGCSVHHGSSPYNVRMPSFNTGKGAREML